MKVREIMTNQVCEIEPDDSVAEAAFTMKESGASCLIVKERGRVIGVISERDLVLGCLTEGHVSFDCTVANHMEAQSQCCDPEMEVGDAALLMMEKNISDLPVLENRQIVGIVSYDDICRAVDYDMTNVA